MTARRIPRPNVPGGYAPLGTDGLLQANVVGGLSTALGARARQDAIACLGDSLTSGPNPELLNYPTVLRWLRGGNVINLGVSGDRLNNVRDRLGSVVEQAPGTCVVLAGTNDIAAGVSPAVMAGYVEEITATLTAAGIVAVWVSLLPRSATYRAQITSWNAWLADYCARHGLRFIDAHSPLSDDAGDLAATYDDGSHLHLTQSGYKLLAECIAAGLPTTHQGQPWRWAGETPLLANGTFADGNSDGLADSFLKTASPGVTAATTTEEHPSAGNWQKLAISGGTGLSSYGAIYQDITNGIVVGQHAEFAFDLLSSMGDTAFVRAALTWKNAASADIRVDYLPMYAYPDVSVAMRLRSERLVIPEGTTRCRVMFSVWGSGTPWAKFGRAVLRSLNP